MQIRPGIEKAGTMILGLAFAGLLFRLLLLNMYSHGASGAGKQSMEAVKQLVGSPLWMFAGVMHVLVAVGLAALAARPTQADQAVATLARVAAMIGAGCFLLLGMSHIHWASAFDSAENVCCASEHSMMVAYNQFRVIVLGSGMFALGSCLLFNGFSHRYAGNKPEVTGWIAMVAGVLAVLHAFLPLPSNGLTVATLSAVITWSAGQVIFGSRIHIGRFGIDDSE